MKIEGLSELQRKLGRLPAAIGNPVLAKALEDAGEIVRSAAQQRAPIGPTGRLRRSMTTKTETDGSGVARVRVGPGAEAFYGFWVERGTKRTQARPFLRPALDANRTKVRNIVRERLERAIAAEAAKG